MQHQIVLLLGALHRNKTHCRPLHGLSDRFGVGGVVLLALHVGLYIFWRNELDVMAQRLELPRPVMGRGTGFKADQVRAEFWQKTPL